MSPEAWESLLRWGIPPLAGALIGYITNDLAIRMLFRPLEEKRLAGIRIPFTPGVIPRRRAELAESIGTMVSRELINAETILPRLDSEGFRGRLEANLRSLLQRLADTPLASLSAADQEALSASLERLLAAALSRFLSSRGFYAGLRGVLNELFDSISSRTLQELLPDLDLSSFLAERVLSRLTAAPGRRNLLEALRRWSREQGRQGIRVGDLLPAGILETVGEAAAGELPELLESFWRWLEEPDIRSQLERRGLRLLRGILDRLNLLQRLVVTAGQFDRTLEQRMPEIVAEAIGELRGAAGEQEVRERLKQAVREGVGRWARKRIDELPLEALLQQGLESLQDPEARKRFAQGLRSFLEGVVHRPIIDLIHPYLGLQIGDIVEFAYARILNRLSRPGSAEELASTLIRFFSRFLKEHGERTLGETLAVTSNDLDRAASILMGRLLVILRERVPALLSSLDIKELVVGRVNSLQVAEVERLLRIVIARHLKWINLFGALLGALIGLIQVVSSRLGWW